MKLHLISQVLHPAYIVSYGRHIKMVFKIHFTGTSWCHCNNVAASQAVIESTRDESFLCIRCFPVMIRFRSKLLSVFLIAAIGIASTGFTVTHYSCTGAKNACDRTCHTAHPASCCKVIAERHNVETNAKALDRSPSGLTILALAFPPQLAVAPQCISKRFVRSQCGHPPDSATQESVVLRI